MPACVNGFPVGPMTRAPAFRQREANGISAVIAMSRGPIAAAIQSSAASGPSATTTRLTKGPSGSRMKALDTKWMAKPVGPPPAAAIGGVSGMLPGATPTFTVDLTAGDYALVCFIPDAKDGKMHLEHGMIQTFKIQ